MTRSRIVRVTHIQPGGEVVQTSYLSDGRTIRVIGMRPRPKSTRHYREVDKEMDLWLAFEALKLVRPR